jgi:hypothetical protein
MLHILGITSLLFVGIVTLYLALRHSQLRWVLPTAYLVRTAAALYHFYIFPLPDGTADAVRWERTGWRWAQDGLAGAWSHFPGPEAEFISWTYSLLYALTGHSPLMAQSLSIMAGIGCVYLVWKLACELWGEQAGLKAAWIATLFPTMVLYSALTMREPFTAFFFLVGLLGVVRWARSGGVWPVILGLFGLIMAGFYHGGMFVAVAAFLGLVAARHGWQFLKNLARMQWRSLVLPGIALTLVVASGIWFVKSNYPLPKLGSFSAMVNLERQINRIHWYHRDNARYSDWIIPQTPAELFWKTPGMMLYFPFAPFPWDIRVPKHLAAMFDGMLYMGLAFLAWRNRKAIWADPGGRAVCWVMLSLLFIFGLGVANFGTGLRHRSKIVAGLILLAAPKLPKLTWRRRE